MKTFRRPLGSGPWMPMLFLTAFPVIFGGEAALDLWLDLDFWKEGSTGSPLSEGELTVLVIGFGVALLVLWSIFIWWLARRYCELQVSPEGLQVVHRWRAPLLIHWEEIRELEERRSPVWSLHRSPVWVLHTTRGEVRITPDVEHCVQLLEQIKEHVPAIRTKFLLPRRLHAAEETPWCHLTRKSYRYRPTLGDLFPLMFVVPNIFMWGATIVGLAHASLDMLSILVFAIGWTMGTVPMSWHLAFVWLLWRRCQITVTQEGMEVMDLHRKQHFYAWSDVVAMEPIVGHMVWRPAMGDPYRQYMVFTRQGNFEVYNYHLRGWAEFKSLVERVTAFNQEESAEGGRSVFRCQETNPLAER